MTFKASPDHETKASYTFTVRATISQTGKADITADRTVTLTVTDVNDAPPVFTSGTTASVDENIEGLQATGSAILAGNAIITATAVNPGTAGNAIRINFTPGGSNSVSVSGSTITVTLNGQINSGVVADLINGHSAASALVTATQSTDLSATSAVWNGLDFSLIAGTDPLADFTAATSDTGDDTVTYALLTTDDGNSFNINSTTGVVTFKASPDHETKASYTFTVRASVTADGSTQTADRTVTLTVNDVNDVAPTITSGATGTARPENTAISTTTEVYDAAGTHDVTPIVWSLKDGVGDEDLFNINSATGVVTFKTATTPDYETKSSYSFTVVATSGTLTTEQAVTVAVSNRDDGDAVFTITGSLAVGQC